MNSTTINWIVDTIVAAAAAIQEAETVTELRNAYAEVKKHLHLLEIDLSGLERRPESLAHRAALEEDLVDIGADSDSALLQSLLILADQLGKDSVAGQASESVGVKVKNIKVGGDLIIEGIRSGGLAFRGVDSSAGQFDYFETRYLRGLYTQCNEVSLFSDQPIDISTLRRPRLQQLYVEHYTQTLPSLEIVLNRLNIPIDNTDKALEILSQRLGMQIESSSSEWSKHSIELISRLRGLDRDSLADAANALSVHEHELQEALTNLSVLEACRLHQQILLLGEPGGGKSTFMRWLASVLATASFTELETVKHNQLTEFEAIWGRGVLPILISMKRWETHLSTDASGTANDLLEECIRIQQQTAELDEKRLMQKFMQRLSLAEPTALILLDGLDEVSDITQRQRLLAAVNDFCIAFPRVHVIVTCRTRTNALWARDKDSLPMQVYTLAPLNRRTISDYIDRLYSELVWANRISQETAANARARLLSAIDAPNRKELAEIASIPLLLNMMAMINVSRGLPDSRVELYEEYIRLLLWEWERTKLDDRGQPTSLELLLSQANVSIGSLELVLNQIAFDAFADDQTEIPRWVVRNALEAIHPGDSAAKAVWAAQVLALIYNRSGLLNTTDEHNLRFTHRTFQEYLAARAMVTGSYLINFSGKIDQKRWQQVILLAINYAVSIRTDYDAVLTVIDELLPISPQDEEEWQRVLTLGEAYVDILGPHRASEATQRRLAQRVSEILPKLLVAASLRQGLSEFPERDPRKLLADLGIRQPVHIPLMKIAQDYLESAGFEVASNTDSSLFVIRPIHASWKSYIRKLAPVKVLIDTTLNSQTIIDLVNVGSQMVGEVPQCILVICNQKPDDSAWLQIATYRANGINVMPVDDSILQIGIQTQRQRAILLDHLEERYLGPQRDLYDRQNPISDRVNFFGREALADWLADNLRQGHAVSIFGLRKMGKSSLLNYVRDRLPYPAAVIDLQVSTVLKDVYNRIVAAWLAHLQTLQPTLSWRLPQRSADETVSAYFGHTVRNLLVALEGAGTTAQLAVFVDEIELIYPCTEPELATYLDFARTLRGLAQEQLGKFNLIVASVDPNIVRTNRLFGQQNPFYNFFRIQYLPPLNEQDCIQMIRNIGAQMGLQYTDDALAFVARISGGHPYWARKLCSLAYKTWKETGPMTQAHLASVARRFVQNPDTAQLLDQRGLWGEVTDRYLWQEDDAAANEAILLALAETEQCTRTDLLSHATKPTAYQHSLAELDNRAIIDEVTDDAFWIHLQLFRNWIRTDKLGKE